jgi:hypothetical protein
MAGERETLLQLLMRSVMAGKLEERWALSALRALAAPEAAADASVTRAALLDALEAEPLEALGALREHLWQQRLRDARVAREVRKTGGPLAPELAAELGDLPLAAIPAREDTARSVSLEALWALLDDRTFARRNLSGAPVVGTIEESLQTSCAAARFPAPLAALVDRASTRLAGAPEAVARAFEGLDAFLQAREQEQRRTIDAALTAGEPVPSVLDDALVIQGWQREWAARADRAARQAALDALLAGRLSRVWACIDPMGTEAWSRNRAQLLLNLRVAKPDSWAWRDWLQWARTQESAGRVAREGWFAQAQQRPLETLLVAAIGTRMPPAALEPLVAWYEEGAAPPRGAFHERWGGAAAAPPRAEAAPPQSPPSRPATPPTQPIARPVPPPVRPPAPLVPPAAPPAWIGYFQSFLAENWYLVAGLAMVVVGASLLAYFTWDKTWLLRYTIMPGLLVGFTFGLARLGTFLERPEAGAYRGSAALLRGAAILLLPVNFMTVALLSDDPMVHPRALAVPVAAAVYLVLFGAGLRRWCRAVHPALGAGLAPTLLLLSSLLTLAPLVHAFAPGVSTALPAIIGLGFYVAFAAVALSVRHFTADVLDAAVAQERRVPWFFGATLFLTYVGSFVWVHAWIERLPRPFTYAALVILAGGLVLHVERRFLSLRTEGARATGESFLGFAFILLGLLMGMGDPHVRILCFSLAGLVWLYQAVPRADVMQYVVGLTLLCLSGGSVGLLEGFPSSALPAIGLVLAAGLGGLQWGSMRRDGDRLAVAAGATQYAVLAVTAIVAVLAQWHDRSEPRATAAWLIAVAAAFVWRGWREVRPRAVLTAMTLLALALPYLGCADMQAYTLRGNTLTFGLAVLSLVWLAAVRGDSEIGHETRSTVLWLYGAFATAAMLLRVAFEPTHRYDLTPANVVMNLAGPILMTAVLIVAAYLSRSLLPSVAAVLIAVVLLPELRLYVQHVFPWIQWGSGLGSGCVAFVLILVAFRVRRAPGLQQLDDGDCFIGGVSFPLRRTDPGLFTIPIVTAVIFLCAKVDTYNFLRNLSSQADLPLRSALALLVVAAAWTLLAVYRRFPGATCFGLVSGLGGVHFLLPHLVPGVHWQWTFVAYLLLLETLIFTIYRRLAGPTELVEPVLVVPTHGAAILFGGALSAIATFLLWGGYRLERLSALVLVLIVSLGVRALVRGRRIYGGLLTALLWTVFLAWTAPSGPAWQTLPERLSIAQSLTPNLWLLIAVAGVYLLLEASPDDYTRVRPLLWAWRLLATLMAVPLGLVVAASMLFDGPVTGAQAALTLVLILLVARMHACGLLLAPAAALGYMLAQLPALAAGRGFEARLWLLLEPTRLAAAGVALALITWAGEWLHRRAPRLLEGPLGYAMLRVAATPFLLLGTTVVSLIAVERIAIERVFWAQPSALLAGYGAALALALVGRRAGAPLLALAGLVLTLPNVLLVRLYLGPALLASGLSNAHLITLGLAVTLLELRMVKSTLRRPDVVTVCALLAEALAAAMLLVLCASYLADPNIEAIRPLRFAISGGMALLAGLYFHRAAQAPVGERAIPVAVCEGLYHFGVTLGLWCIALLVPWLRHPQTALVALAFPGFYFHLRAEITDDETFARRCRNSAATIGLLILALYAFRGALQMLVFPEQPIRTVHYHENALLVMAVGLMLLRLHAFGGSEWLPFYGGLALSVGSYFAVTRWPGLSPFEDRMPAAWAAVGLAHFWAAATYQRSPLRVWVQDMARLADETWHSLRHGWGLCALAGVHLLVLLAALDGRTDTRMIAPLVVGAASVVLHYGLLRGSLAYGTVAAVEILLALHADFVVPSYLPARHVVWVLLALWALALLIDRRIANAVTTRRITAPTAIVLGLVSLAHVTHHGPASDVGLWTVALAALLALATPTRQTAPHDGLGNLAIAFVYAAPTWLVFFGAQPWTEEGFPEGLHTGGLLWTLGTLLATGSAALAYARSARADHEVLWGGAPRLVNQALALAAAHGPLLRTLCLAVSFGAALLVHAAHAGHAFSSADFVLFAALYVACLVSWRHEGRSRRSMAAHFAAQLAALSLAALVRRQLFVHGFWTMEYDIWLSLIVSFVLTGAKGKIDERPHEERVPATVALWALPALTLLWTLGHDLGTNTSLQVVGVQSVLFAFLGKDDRESPYHVVAVSGFVAFVCMVFWGKLELHVLQAYVIPVGLGILALLQMFERRVDPVTRNQVRSITLLIMLGSSGYHALVDDRYPIAFNAVLLALCLLAMAAGSLLRIRAYLVLGFSGVLFDLASIVVKVLLHMDRGPRMTIIGALVLVAGVGLVGGAVYYKARRDEVEAWIESWRPRLARWQ